SAVFWHFVSTARALTAGEYAVLERILTYGPAAHASAEQGRLLLVVPRLGTISPWSSKATEIARHCGLQTVERIERGVAYHMDIPGPAPAALLALIHVRMTETVLDSMDAVAHLFAHYPPQP